MPEPPIDDLGQVPETLVCRGVSSAETTAECQTERESRVEKWRGGLGGAYRLPALSVAGASLASPCSVSTSRSSNRACGFLAHGSPTGFTDQHTMVSLHFSRDSENFTIFAGK